MRTWTRRRDALLAISLALAAPAGCTPTPSDPQPNPTARPEPPAAQPTPTAATPAVPPTTSVAPAPTATAEAKTAPTPAVTDTLPTSKGDLRITPVTHGTVVIEHGGKAFHFDPWSQGKLDGLPKADFIFVTDIHADHLDQAAIDKVKKPGTVIVGPPAVAEKLPGITVLKNGESKDIGGVNVVAVPMYNLKRGPSEGKLFHDKGRGNGYVLTFGDKKVYVSGDTECTPEMKALKAIDVAFISMNLPFTMPPSEAAECIKAFRPKIIFPYHYRGSNLDELTKALEGEQGIEVHQRTWY